jgi:hypothetical protein
LFSDQKIGEKRKMNSKKAITLLLIATMLIGLIPITQANAIGLDPLGDNDGVFGDTIEVTGDDVTSGFDVNVYWDAVKAWNTYEGLMNTTEADNDGTWTIWFDVPEVAAGEYRIWVEDDKTGETEFSGVFTVLSDIDLSASSGLAEDDIVVEGYGFGDEVEVAIIMVDNSAAPTTTALLAPEDTGEDGNTVETEFEFTLDNTPIEPGTVTITDGVDIFTDPAGDGVLDITGGTAGAGSINYVTGEVELEFDTVPLAVNIMADYMWFDNVADKTFVLEDEDVTNDRGSFDKTVEVPAVADMDKNPYEVMILDGDGLTAADDYTIGPVISLDATAGPTGLVVEIEGRGFSPSGVNNLGYIPDDGVTIEDEEGDFAILDCTILDLDDNPDGAGALVDGIECDDDGEFDLEIVIPWCFVVDDHIITVTDAAGETAEADFEVTGLPGLTLEVGYGTQGARLDVTGVNFTQISGEEVEFWLWNDEFDKGLVTPGQEVEEIGGTADTDGDGEFDTRITIPAVDNGNYQIVARQADYGIYGNASFRVTLMVVVLSSESGNSGDLVTMTGSGFSANGDINASLAGEEVIDITLVGGATTFSEEFFIPTAEPGVYTITVEDQDSGIEVEMDFEILETSYMELDPITAPNDFNVTIIGYNFAADDVGGNNDLTFVLWNKTADGEVDEDWDLDVQQGPDPGSWDAVLNDEGNFTAWFVVPDEDDLSVGTYYINCTDEEGLYAMIVFELVDETQTITPKKAVFTVGEVVAFDISVSFVSDDSYIQIMAPSGSLFWETDPFDDPVGPAEDDWITVGDVKVVPYFKQLSNGQLMELPLDAPLGEWTWTWYDVDDEELDSGVFTVEAAADSVIADQVLDLNNQINDLATQLTDITSEFDSVKSDIADVAAIAEQAVTAANLAAEAVQTVATTANQASVAADNAATAANAAKDAANQLNTLVYGAIGAALVALAAIVSLMQISRRIAG